MIQYILECIAFQLVFLIIYDLFLKRETFFQWNRLYLIGTYIISMILPWIKIEAMKTTVPQSFQTYPEFLWNTSDVAITTTAVQEASFIISWEYALLYGGMLIATLLFSYKLFQIYALKRKGEVHHFKDFTQIIIFNSSIAFSFFKSIFLGDKVIAKEHQSIVQHELVHIRQRHSYDLMFFELMRIVGWFNPLVYVYQSRVSELHEFIADAQVAKSNKKEQYEFLLSLVFQTQNISFINQFFKTSLIKKRIVMLQRNQSKRIWKLKYLLLLPLVLGMLAYTSLDKSSSTNEILVQVDNKEDEKLIKALTEELENEIEHLIVTKKELANNDILKKLDKRSSAVFYISNVVYNPRRTDKIFSKEEYFKSELLQKWVFEELEKAMEDKRSDFQSFAKEYPLPSSERYKSYVGRKEAFLILDINLQFSVKAYDQNIEIIDKPSKYGTSTFIFEVDDVRDLTGVELRAFNNKLSEIFERQISEFKNMILTDDTYVFKIYTEAPATQIEVSQLNYEGIVSREGKIIKLNVLNARELTKAENEQREMLIKEFSESDYYEKLIISDGVYQTTILSVEDNSVLITSGKEPDPVPFAMVEQVPIFPGCEDAEDMRKCFNEKIQKHISKNFNYPKEAQDKGIQGRVNTIFTITKKGEIEGLRMRGPNTILEKEVARIIDKLPKMKPGKHKGKKVDVPFSIPVVFKLDTKNTFEKLPVDSKLTAATRQYNELVAERNRLLKSANEKSPIITDIDEQLERLKESIRSSLKSSDDSSKGSFYGGRSLEQMSSEDALQAYNQLLKERKRLLKSSNEKNPIIVNLDQQIKALKAAIEQESDLVPFATIDEVPVFPGCEDADNRRNCFNKMIQKHISKNFNYPKEAQEKGIQGRVAVMFTIATDGSIQNIRKRGPDSLLENEVERIIKRLPKMKPGKQKGKPVNVPFSIPITFKLNDNNTSESSFDLSKFINKTTLLVIDGEEYMGKLNHVDKDKIDSIRILEDEAAFKKYGEKGKNGVVEITTKKFVFNKPNLDTIKLDTNSGTDPIYFIDGKESSKEKMKAINPNDIESINVLKGESAEALYGEKAKNGVIQIITKKKD